MKREKRLVSKELAEKMKELGFEQELQAGNFYWISIRGEWKLMMLDTGEDGPETTPYEWCKAYNVSELGEMLWKAFEEKGWDSLYESYGQVFNFPGTQRIGDLGIINLMRRPDMGAKMLIWLAEQKNINSNKTI